MRSDGFRWRLLKQAILQKKAKALLIVLAVAMGASVVTALLNLQSDLRRRMNRELRDYGPNVILQPSPMTGSPYLHDSLLPALKEAIGREGLISYTPQIFMPVQINGQKTVMIGVDFLSLSRLYPGWTIDADLSQRESFAILGIRLAGRQEIKKGNHFQITLSDGNLAKLSAAGFLESGEAEDDQIFVPLATAQKLSKKPSQFHVIALSALGDIADVQNKLDELIARRPEVSYQVLRKIAAAEALMLDKISRLMGMVIALISLILLFCIHTTVSSILLYRQKEIALFRVLGARRKQIMMELSLELLLLGIVGAILGFVIGIFMAQVLGKVLFQTYIAPRFDIFVITIISSLAMTLISSALPIRRAVNRQAAVVLKEA